MEGFDDADIAEAIARSLLETSSNPAKSRAPPEVIEIEDDDEEEEIQQPPNPAADHEDAQFEADLRRAMEESKAEAARSASTATHASASSTPAGSGVQESSPPPPTRPGGGFPFDRAQMERERLARQKRLRPDIAQDTPSAAAEADGEDDDDDDADDTRSAKRQRVSSSSVPARANIVSSSTRTSTPVAGMSKAASGSNTGEGLYFDGELRQTANKHVDPAKDTKPVFRLTDILSPRHEIAFAVVSAYVINLPWFYSFFNRETPVVVATQDPHGNETIKEVLPNWIKTTPFLRGGRGCQHMKVMLLFYRTGRLRVVVSTANLIEYDWRDIENSVWVQDVPLRPAPIAHDAKASDFPTAFTRVLRAVNVVPALLTLIRNGHENLPLRRIEDLRSRWDFSKVKVALVASLAGKHEGWPKVILTGHTGLMKALQDMNLRPPAGKELQLECQLAQGSSIGAYTTQWTNEFYCSTRGESAEQWLDESRKRREKLPYPPLKILFPTRQTVQQSELGEEGGGTMFCRREQWGAARFPRDRFYDSRSKRGRVLMHSKMIVGTFKDSAAASMRALDQFDTPSDGGDDDDEIVEVGAPSRGDAIGWAYVGSHNFTPSAWGTLSGSSFNPTLNITNFELGVLFPLRSEEELERVACWERPPRKYSGADVPWIQSESPFFA
ncbi:hypothetical protein PHLGIDRAFT_124343 [Phlebiopsis gigantea 11061_1 CR5-6]|uniref:Phospholipase D/nuclease n=1 Tax=Phlebiopsis gigantea (strain 11061_1 CR5-6) TaxID=745531 RepID=A0A0C3SFJ2_PHLG1|nr:hypothetical protein PHLGIDRAFT_124343 [Phlebiopsis gigantea 11061_1 CR5-6]